MRAETEEKAVAIVGKGRVRIETSTIDVTTAEVDGEHGTYRVTLDPEGQWCNCAHGSHRSPHAECSHVLAVRIERVRLEG